MGIVADTHGVLDPRVLHALSGSDVVVHAGDVGDPAILRALAGVTSRLVAVRGNNDTVRKWPARADPGPESLPPHALVDLPGGVLAVVHGDRVLPASDRHRRLRIAFPDARLVVYGHSHRLCIDREARPWVANPGAAGRARTFGGPSLLLLRASASGWRLTRKRFPPAA